jgi:hypothetical protein
MRDAMFAVLFVASLFAALSLPLSACLQRCFFAVPDCARCRAVLFRLLVLGSLIGPGYGDVERALELATVLARVHFSMHVFAISCREAGRLDRPVCALARSGMFGRRAGR